MRNDLQSGYGSSASLLIQHEPVSTRQRGDNSAQQVRIDVERGPRGQTLQNLPGFGRRARSTTNGANNDTHRAMHDVTEGFSGKSRSSVVAKKCSSSHRFQQGERRDFPGVQVQTSRQSHQRRRGSERRIGYFEAGNLRWAKLWPVALRFLPNDSRCEQTGKALQQIQATKLVEVDDWPRVENRVARFSRARGGPIRHRSGFAPGADRDGGNQESAAALPPRFLAALSPNRFLPETPTARANGPGTPQ